MNARTGTNGDGAGPLTCARCGARCYATLRNWCWRCIAGRPVVTIGDSGDERATSEGAGQ